MKSAHSAMNISFDRLKLFIALSRTPHMLLDLATPALAAILALGRIPSIEKGFLGFLAAFAGYTAVYAFNDLVDYHADEKKIRETGPIASASYIDAIVVRHPLARGLLSMREGVIWTAAWAVTAIVAAYFLNPMCVFIFFTGCVLEYIYCKLLDVTFLRTIVSGFVKTSGGIAAIFAVDPHPSLPFLLVFFLWIFFWEIGGQNIPADWHDLPLDVRVKAKTIPVYYGTGMSGLLILLSVSISTAISCYVLRISKINITSFFTLLPLAAGLFLLVLPAIRLYSKQTVADASAYFNRASYYPFTMLLIVLAYMAI